VAKGDVLPTIAKKLGVSVRALLNANPGVVPTKLKVGQKLHVPASAAPSAQPAPAASAAAPADTTPAASPANPASGGEQVYTVQSGDTLTSIAKKFGVSVKAIHTANAMTSNSIKVGRKLKIPAKSSGSTPAATPDSGTAAPPTR
jgi:LysM repeat protein